LGISVDKVINDKKVKLSILPNPSTLETVNGAIMGHTKAYADIALK
jgi:2-oxoglutarate dehydrogenase complex dehydrogenase (E1) component-like enzyme